jgi:general stress protein YciG
LHFDPPNPRNTGEEDDVAKEDRGFASMDRAKQREIASKGGKAAHQKGTAHEWTSEEARDAGRKGGIASHRRRREQQGGGGGAMDMAANDRAVAMDWSNAYGSERGTGPEPVPDREE